jgi:hypothetical protein
MLISNNHSKRRKQSMKKTFLVIFVGLALALMASPSQALNSIDDNVPGVNPLLPFFLVDKAGFPTSGLDTLVVIQEIGGIGAYTAHKTKGQLHLIIKDKFSHDKGSIIKEYTPNDVEAYSVRDLIDEMVGVGVLADLEIVLNGVTYYSGYIDFFNSIDGETFPTDNNLVAFMYVIDLANGWAAASTMPVWEDASDPGYVYDQWRSDADAILGTTYELETFSPNGYAISEFRERNDVAAPGYMTASFRLMPRWFLADLNAETFIPIWSSSLHSTSASTWTYELIALIYDNDENMLNVPINIPYELNWIDVRNLLTSSWQSKTGGWIDIPFSDDLGSDGRGDDPFESSWLAYSYQTASSADAGINWSVLHGVHREVGTLVYYNNESP